MYKYCCLNPIAEEGLSKFSKEFVLTDNNLEADGIIVRSAKMNDMEISDNLKCIVRAGIGVNNVPIDKCNESGVVVFNTPGANANAVKEMVISAMLLSSRDIMGGVQCVECNKGKDDVATVMEKEKKKYKGTEISGKNLGIIGLGAIGVMVANAAIALGMKVFGYDPYLSVKSALNLDPNVERVLDVEDIYKKCNFITVHVPLVESTKGIINAKAIDLMRNDVVIINYSRDILCDEQAIINGLDSGKIRKYVSDFANPLTAGHKNCIVTPHLGASTLEAEKNSAVMAVEELSDFLQNGNINHSVNFSNCSMGSCDSVSRITIIHKNTTNMIARFSTFLAEKNINIDKMINSSKGDMAYTMIDIDSRLSSDALTGLKNIDSVIKVREI